MPNIFVNGPGNLIDANQLNANFAALEKCLVPATTTSLGLVQPDGKTITVNGQGVISAGLSGDSVLSNVDLMASKTTTYPLGVWRIAYQGAPLAPTSPPLFYLPSSSPCVLNAGAGDGGSQVRSADGLCWLADFVGGEILPTQWGAIGDGTTDDTAKVQAALTATCNAGKVLLWGAKHYLLTAVLTGPGFPKICQIAGQGNAVDVYQTACPAGSSAVIVNSDIDAVHLTDATDSVTGICFQMATAPGLRGAGAAITVAATPTHNGRSVIRDNTILNPYDGIVIGGATTGTTQTNGTVVANNVIKNPSHIGASDGLISQGASTNGTAWYNNQIACFSANSGSTGMYFADSAPDYNGTTNGPHACNWGTKIVEGAHQILGGGYFQGVIGDASITNDLYMDATDPTSILFYAQFSHWWASANKSTDTPIPDKELVGGC